MTECSICFDEFSVDDKRDLVELDCNNNHIFHIECIKAWLQQPNHTNCPLCREEIKIVNGVGAKMK